MKIEDAVNQLPDFGEKLLVDNKKTRNLKQNTFDKQFRKVAHENYDKRLMTILDAINTQSDKLSKNIDIRELKRYKKLISEFLYEATQNSFKFHKEGMLDRRGRHRVYAVVKKINTSLDELTKEVLKEQKDNIKVLKKLDDIKGLIIDLVM